jgi:hypothetical protein
MPPSLTEYPVAVPGPSLDRLVQFLRNDRKIGDIQK